MSAEASGSAGVLRGRAPSVVEPLAAVVLALALGSLAGAAAIFRQGVAGTAFDTVAFLLRMLAVGLAVRLGVVGRRAWLRLRRARRARDGALAIADDGLRLRLGSVETHLEPDDLLAMRAGTAAEGDDVVYAILTPVASRARGTTFVAIPSAFDVSAAALEARLAQLVPRRVPDDTAPTDAHSTEPRSASAAELLTRAERGEDVPGIVVPGAPIGVRTPVSALFFPAFALGVASETPGATARLAAFAIAIALSAAMFVGLAARARRPRRRALFVLTEEALILASRRSADAALAWMMPGRSGAPSLRAAGHAEVIRWPSVLSVEVERLRRWSLFGGVERNARVTLRRSGALTTRIDEASVGIPFEVWSTLLGAHRDGTTRG